MTAPKRYQHCVHGCAKDVFCDICDKSQPLSGAAQPAPQIHLFYRLWDKAVGKDGYNKGEWQTLERFILPPAAPVAVPAEPLDYSVANVKFVNVECPRCKRPKMMDFTSEFACICGYKTKFTPAPAHEYGYCKVHDARHGECQFAPVLKAPATAPLPPPQEPTGTYSCPRCGMVTPHTHAVPRPIETNTGLRCACIVQRIDVLSDADGPEDAVCCNPLPCPLHPESGR